MTLREFLYKSGVDVIEDTQGTLDLDIVIVNKEDPNGEQVLTVDAEIGMYFDKIKIMVEQI